MMRKSRSQKRNKERSKTVSSIPTHHDVHRSAPPKPLNLTLISNYTNNDFNGGTRDNNNNATAEPFSLSDDVFFESSLISPIVSPFRRSEFFKNQPSKNTNLTLPKCSNKVCKSVSSPALRRMRSPNRQQADKRFSNFETRRNIPPDEYSAISPEEMLRLRKQHTIASDSPSNIFNEKVPQVCVTLSDDSDNSDTEDRHPFVVEKEHERLHGETEEDAEIRKNAIAMRSRRRSSVVQIPTASIQMDLHTIYLESINGTKKKGKSFEEPKASNKKLQKNAAVYSSFEGEDTEKKGRFALLKQKFWKDDSQSRTLEDFKEFKEHLKSNLVEFSDHELAKYKDAHWSNLDKFKEEDTQSDRSSIFHDEMLSDQERKRFEALWELFYAEVRYLINNLVVLHDVFAKPLQHAKSFGFLTCVNESLLFANLDDLIQATSDFANKLLKIFNDCALSVCRSTEIIVDGFKMFDDCLTPKYNEYSLNYQKAKSHLELLRDDETFQEFLKYCEQDPRCNRRHIEDFLVAPLQHLTKLPLLLKAIRKHSPQNDHNHHLLTHTIYDIEQSIKSIEKKISSLMNFQRLQEIQELVVWPVLGDMDKKNEIPEFVRSDLNNNHSVTVLMNPNRTLLQEGALILADNNKTEFYVFLFDDMLLLTKPRKRVKPRRNTGPDERSGNEPTLNRNKKQQSLSDAYNSSNYIVHKQPLSIDRLKIYDCDDQASGSSGMKNAFCLVNFNRYHQAVCAYTFITSTPEEKTLWMKNIKKAKDDATSEGFSSAKDMSSDEEYML
ncbi:pleckstrin homology domain-containing family G member 7-like isoform X4 [Clytia hemisphaerica]